MSECPKVHFVALRFNYVSAAAIVLLLLLIIIFTHFGFRKLYITMTERAAHILWYNEIPILA